MSGRSRVAQQAFDLAMPVANEMGLELVDAEYKKEGSYYYLRLYIDKRGGISIEDCELVSRAVDPIFDKQLQASFDYFEVSSPGLSRPLVTFPDFLRHVDEEVTVSFFTEIAGKKKHIFLIAEASPELVVFRQGEETLEVPYDKISSAKLVIKI